MFRSQVAKSKAKEAVFSNPKESQRQPFDANLGHPDDDNGTPLWSSAESNGALHDVIGRLAAKAADEVSDNDSRQASDLQYGKIRAEMAGTNSQKRFMTAREKADKQAFIDKMISTRNPTNDTNKTAGIDDTWTIDKEKNTFEPNKASDVSYGPDATNERPR